MAEVIVEYYEEEEIMPDGEVIRYEVARLVERGLISRNHATKLLADV